jgi:two-component system response regulator AtoC
MKNTAKTINENKFKILVVDDEAGVRDFLKFLLEPLGYEIHTANNGTEAIAIVFKEEFDIIFMDVHMPGMSGIEALEKIKKMRPEQSVVIFSSSSDPFYVLESQAKQKGALECLFKPFELDDVLKMIDKVRGTGRLE